MRVGLVIYGSLDTLSGGYLYDRKFVQTLQAAGDTVEVLSLPWRTYRAHLQDNFSAEWKARLEGLRVDILLQDELNHPSLFLLNSRLKRTYPLVSIVHHLRISEDHPTALRPFYRWVERRYLRSVDGFLYNSKTTRRMVLKERVLPAPGLVAYPAGDRFGPALTEAAVRERALTPGPLKVLFLGNLIARKGLHTLLEALAGLTESDWRLTVIGRQDVEPAYFERVQAQIQAGSLQERVSFLGALEDEQLAQQMACQDVLAMPSWYEGFGIVYLEGMGFGLPAIASTGGAAGEIIREGENGFLIPPGGVQALENRLRELACQRGRLLRMSLAARQRFLAHPGWETSMQAGRDFLLQLVESR